MQWFQRLVGSRTGSVSSLPMRVGWQQVLLWLPCWPAEAEGPPSIQKLPWQPMLGGTSSVDKKRRHSLVKTLQTYIATHLLAYYFTSLCFGHTDSECTLTHVSVCVEHKPEEEVRLLSETKQQSRAFPVCSSMKHSAISSTINTAMN